VLCAGWLACAASALAVDDPLRLPPGAPVPSHGTHATSPASTGLIQQVDPSTLTGTHLVDFQDVPGAGSPGMNYDGIVTSASVAFAERFVGQTVAFNGVFDVLSGTGREPLAAQVGAPNQNLDMLTDIFANNILVGLGPVEYPDLDAIGEGAVAMRFPRSVSQVGFDVFGTDGGGSLTVTFFRHDGTLIDSLTIPTLLTPDMFRLAFQRVDDVNDIAGITD